MIATNSARDEARIFQALCTELTRLSGLRPPPLDSIAHTRMLRDRYACAVQYNRVQPMTEPQRKADRAGLDTPLCPNCEHAHWPGEVCTRVTPAAHTGFSPRCGCAL